MLFREVIGQESVKKRLIQSVFDNRVSHAQLFLGGEGCGKLALAIAYAQYISCENKTSDDSCGICSSCIKYNKLAHPDLHFVFPVNTNKEITKDPISDNFITSWRETLNKTPYISLDQWYEIIGIENKQGVISAKESNEIMKKLNLMTYESEYKIMIIWMPEKMNPSASNKMLKILEEPPGKTLFLLVSENQDQLLPTILSRTQLVKILRIPDAELAKALNDKHNISHELASKISFLSEGNYIEALKLLNQAEEENYYSVTFIQWMRLCFAAKMIETLDWVENVSAIGRERQKNFLNYALQMVRESLLMNYADKSLVKLNGEELDFLVKFSPYIHGGNCISLSEELNTAYFHIERNANPKILFLDLSIRVMKLLKVKA